MVAYLNVSGWNYNCGWNVPLTNFISFAIIYTLCSKQKTNYKNGRKIKNMTKQINDWKTRLILWLEKRREKEKQREIKNFKESVFTYFREIFNNRRKY